MAEQHETFPGRFEALLLIALLIGIEILVTAVVLATGLLAGTELDSVVGFVTVVGNGILFIGLMAYKRIGYRELFHPAKHSVAATMGLVTAPILLLVPGLMLFAVWLDTFVQQLFPMSAEDLELFNAMAGSSVLSILFACLAAPVLEEMLFRGVMLRAFLRQYTRTFAILWSATLFAIAHFNVYQLVTAFTVGIVSGWLYERCRSLWPCILLHAAYNGLATYENYLLISQPESAAGALSSISASVAIGTAIVGAITLIRLLGGARPPSART